MAERDIIERLRAELQECKEIERATHSNELDLQVENERLRAEIDRLKREIEVYSDPRTWM